MRDFEQMREKTQVSLERRQIVALALGALVLLCSVFALGLSVGRKLAHEEPRPADLTALDVVQAEPPKPAPAAPPTPRAAALVPPQAKPASPPDAHAAALAPSPAKPAPAPEAALADTHGETAVIPAPVREPLVVPPPPKPPPPPGGIALTPPPRDLGAWTVQIGASPEKGEALRLENKARAAGLKPYVVEANLGAKGTWYRVRVGSFPDKDKASRYRSDVERELRSTAIVMASH
ncbi:MAG TPA: SPOR domain-containing protein [Myxococcales bacterium]|nr:SPOR domain-containing protein [Myxococcales bacterium]